MASCSSVSGVALPEFWDRTAVLATKHRKEMVIAPLLSDAFRIQVALLNTFDSDRFGTFTRDVARPGNQLETARIKAQAVLAEAGETLAIASEGSFGPHPSLPFSTLNRELVLLLDTVSGCEWVGQAMSSETNFAHQRLSSWEEAVKFAHRVQFPSHALMVAQSRDAIATPFVKGITTWEQLEQVVRDCLTTSPDGTIHVETDMRAMFNPMRMQVIEQATQNLVERMRSPCPQCGWPGFWPDQRRPGLPCAVCHTPTPLTQALISQCTHCGHRQTHPFPDNIQIADPLYCLVCNP
jgi:hypothetical protein